MSIYKIPGVYIEEKASFPPSVAATATAVPAFLGYTTVAVDEPRKVTSLMEFESIFGPPPVESGPVVVLNAANELVGEPSFGASKSYHLYYYVEHYFRNGGGPCYILSVGAVPATPPATNQAYLDALAKLRKLDEPTLIVLSDALAVLKDAADPNGTHAKYFGVVQAALEQCGTLMDRFVIIDMPEVEGDFDANLSTFRGAMNQYHSYGAAYYPFLRSTLSRRPVFNCRKQVLKDKNGNRGYSGWIASRNRMPILSFTGAGSARVEVNAAAANDEAAVFTAAVSGNTTTLTLKLKDTTTYTPEVILTAFNALADKMGFELAANTATITPAPPANHAGSAFVAPTLEADSVPVDASTLRNADPVVYSRIAAAIAREPLALPPAPAMAGVYCTVDRDRGVWKAPANVGLSATAGPVVRLSRSEQERLDVDETSGKSVNCILNFNGQGVLPWGARTLDGNSLDWRYISVRRLFVMAEESIKKATQSAVFEPNDRATWSKVKAMIDNFLFSLWQQGALMGSKPEEAYSVKVGLGETMTSQDVLDGRMIVQVAMAPVRPAEFIILQFSQMQQAS